ncbi:hypothetical protein CH92_17920 [Stutzerimonas stutzeri]|uniref:Uncharacterized protein n=1 Tax=Stutzerimonas stutzeri TaxID=316 RepID=W8RGM4_STUST|nr:hypothetical protein CH92_17920 [Stutzerimonas stutzeri]
MLSFGSDCLFGIEIAFKAEFALIAIWACISMNRFFGENRFQYFFIHCSYFLFSFAMSFLWMVMLYICQ